MATIYSSTNDGYITIQTNSWAASRGASSGDSVGDGSTRYSAAAQAEEFSGRGANEYALARSFFEFDTSGISSAPDDATLKLYGYNQGTSDVILVRSEQSASLAVGDIDTLYNASTELGNTDGSGTGTLAGIGGLQYSAEISTWNTSGYNDIELNATALSDMASLDTFKACLMNYDYDFLDITIAGSSAVRTGVYFADNSGTSKDPYIDYTAASVTVTYNATFFGANF